MAPSCWVGVVMVVWSSVLPVLGCWVGPTSENGNSFTLFGNISKFGFNLIYLWIYKNKKKWDRCGCFN